MNEVDFMREIGNLQEQINALRNTEIGGIWIPYTPAVVGFSSLPPGLRTIYTVIGSTVILMCSNSGNGVSNSTSFTISAPISADITQPEYTNSLGWYVDNGVTVRGQGYARIVAASPTIVQLASASGPTGWTASGSKAAYFTLAYSK